MAVKVLIKRRFNTDDLKEAHKLINQARYHVLQQKGYISSETLTSLDTPGLITVVSMWHDIEQWKRWKNSERRMRLEAEFEKLLETQTEYEAYAM
jgi:quinol monooxygenase YgiN